MDVQASPAVPARGKDEARAKALADLRQATWEASQLVSYDEIRDYVEGVIAEIARDEP